MIGYVYLSRGPIETAQHKTNPALRDQLRNLQLASEAMNDPQKTLVVEKVAKVEDFSSLRKLKVCFAQAAVTRDKVYIDDFRRLFRKVPPARRKNFFESIKLFSRIFCEVRSGGRSLSQLSLDDFDELLNVTGLVRFQLDPPRKSKLSAAERRRQTAAAREKSISERSKRADKLAQGLAYMRNHLLTTRDRVTLQDVANAANASWLTTTRGNPWTAASVKRMLDRLEPSD